jgi:hypothetical protein
MTVPRRKKPRKHPRTTIERSYTYIFGPEPANEDTPVPPAPWLDPDTGTAPAPLTCYACGRPLFALPTSMLLDLVVVALESLAELKHALETEVRP